MTAGPGDTRQDGAFPSHIHSATRSCPQVKGVVQPGSLVTGGEGRRGGDSRDRCHRKLAVA